MHPEVQKIFEFSTLIEDLEKIERFKGKHFWNYYPKRERYASVADHSWRVAMLVMMFDGRLTRKFDSAKALKIALIHDLSEIITGDLSPLGRSGTGADTYAFRPDLMKRKQRSDMLAAKKLFSCLPKDQASDMVKLVDDYVKCGSFEAKVVDALDKIEAMLQVLEYRKGSLFPKHLDFTIRHGLQSADVDPSIRQFAELIVYQLHKRYREFKA